MANYTEELALRDLSLVLGSPTQNHTSSSMIHAACMADAFALIERHDLRVEAVLMSPANFEVFQRNLGDSVTSPRNLWGAEIFSLLMEDNEIYLLSRDFADRGQLLGLHEPADGLPVFCRLTLTSLQTAR